jgi:plastocyanin
MTTPRLTARVGAGIGASVLAMTSLVACGGTANTAPPATAPANSDLIVRAKPAIAWDQSGYAATSHDGKLVVTLINDSGFPHNLHIVDGNGDDIDKKAPRMSVGSKGDEATGTFTLAPGKYTVLCKVPGHGNMKSTLTVG